MISKRLESVLNNCSTEEASRLLLAFRTAEESLMGVARGDGSPFLEHALSVAEIVAFELGLMPSAIIAVFLHEAARVKPEILEESAREFGDEILLMVKSLNRISGIRPKDTGLQAENYRKLIVSYSPDPRVTLIKLADRLEVMRSLDLFTRSSQIKKATETLLLYAPLAHQLGLYNLKSELEDLSFKYTEPEHYRTITNMLKAGERERKQLAGIFVKPLEESLRQAGISYTLKSRTKTAYSIYRKMQVQQIPFEKIADIFAIRIIIDTPAEREKELCWKTYSIVTEHYIPDETRLRDWITVPKSNGYESLHTTVMIPGGQSVEVQIRSGRMDEIAENGYASHWSYKGIKNDQGLNRWLLGVKRLLQSDDKNREAGVVTIPLEDIFVFTPEGDLRRLPSGATVLDFAFDIHTNLGVKCASAKINGKPSAIRERLSTGDVVEITTGRNQRPSQDWLSFVVTSKARAKIRQKLKEEEAKTALTGRELLERRMNNWKLDLNDETLFFLAKHYKYKTITDFYTALANEEVDLSEIKQLVTSRQKADESDQKGEGDALFTSTPRIQKKEQERSYDHLLIDDSLKSVGYKLSRCCNPIPGDEVFGFVTVREGIKIHRINCPNAARLLDNYPYRIQKVRWRESIVNDNFQVAIRVSSYTDNALSRQITEIVNSFSLSVRYFSVSNNKKGLYEAKIELYVPDNQILDKLLFNLKKIKGVKSVSRISNV
ncbi:MAG: RelA/SpoT family protein [Bacteroidales bacterium]|nr:RelA/SpoT family protein [Bacteroidales bacterium]MDD3989115.1 RelA/SpoT family protein [Bacteroidales bacterium]MDD4638136.1 RelA/SpoT family protein [Bacteroidales bacterium]